MADIQLGVHTIRSHGTQVARFHLYDWIILILLAVTDGLLNIIEPFHRFVGRDMMTDLRYPLKGNTVPFWAVPVIGIIGPMVIISGIYIKKKNVYDFHHAILGLLFSVLITAVITDAIKDGVGRPRPDFFWRCFPDGKEVYDNVTTDVICHGSKAVIKEGHKSFPSGHSSWSFAGLGFLSWYLAGKINLFDRRGHVGKLCLVIAPLLLAAMVAVSRVDDYWHHWQDVFAGGLIGSVVASFCYLQFFPAPYDVDVNSKPSIRQNQSSISMISFAGIRFEASPSIAVVQKEEKEIEIAREREKEIARARERKESIKMRRLFEELSEGLRKIGGEIEFCLPDNFLKGDENYTFIEGNIYLNKRKFEDDGIFCNCALNGSSNSCDGDCHCTMLFSCCSLNCKCGTSCNNKPFQQRPIKKLKVTKTEKCGYGLVAEEDIKRGEFLIEYVGEVIDDKTCEERLWKMKERGDTNFYLCEVNSNMVIDATNKGNISRFVNHSCDPNTEMQKWRVDGETRVGIFASKDIKKGEDVTYDYMFVQFGADQVCHCGSVLCKEKLGRADLVLRREARTKDCLQTLVRVWRRRFKMFMEGFIFSYDAETNMHTIMFVDRSKEVLNLSKEAWYLLPQENPFRK